MKVIYNDLIEQLKPLLDNETLRWIDWDKGQLKRKSKEGRYPVAYPCLLIRIDVPKASDIDDLTQDCNALITATLAFDPHQTAQSSASADQQDRDRALEPYDVIATVYKTLQGYSGKDNKRFAPLARTRQGEVNHSELFTYEIVFGTEFEDCTAE